MSVLIELFDAENQINNVIAGLVMGPERVVFIGHFTAKLKPMRQAVSQMLAERLPGAKVHWRNHKSGNFEDVCQQLERVLMRFGAENCVVDVTGGGELPLLAAGQMGEMYRFPVIAWMPSSGGFRQISGERMDLSALTVPAFTIKEAISLRGGRLVRNGHGALQRDDDDLLSMVPALFALSMQDQNGWRDFVQYFQQINRPPYQTDERRFAAPRQVAGGSHTLTLPVGMFDRLCGAGFIERVSMDDESVAFRLSQPRLAGCLCDVGLTLELYIYAALKATAMYDDVDVSNVICWDDDDTPENDVFNEVDVIALRGLKQLFVSCKFGAVDTSALNELNTITQRFGSSDAAPILAAARDVRHTPLASRADSMGITLISGDDLAWDSLIRRFKALAGGENVTRQERAH